MSKAADRAKPGEAFAIWEGVYPTFELAAAGVAGPGFDGELWRTRSLAAARTCLAALADGRPIPSRFKQRSVLLPVVAAMMLARRDRLRVLDFGGGLGIGFMTLSESIPQAPERIDYTIVEVPLVCDEGRKLFPGGVRYSSALPANAAFDLVHAASAIQYVDDWRGLLQSLAACRAEFMLLSDVFAGSIPTFVTLQNYYDSRIRHWFFNLDELIEVCSRAGYTLVMKSVASLQRFGGAEDTLPMDRFPETHRLGESLHLLFSRTA